MCNQDGMLSPCCSPLSIPIHCVKHIPIKYSKVISGYKRANSVTNTCALSTILLRLDCKQALGPLCVCVAQLSAGRKTFRDCCSYSYAVTGIAESLFTGGYGYPKMLVPKTIGG